MWSADRIRGALAGVACAALAVAAHGSAGEMPRSSAPALLVVVSGAIGAMAGSSAGRGRFRVFGLLALGQLLGHVSLASACGAAHGDSPAHTHHSAVLMVAAHGAATLLCALLIAVAERLYRAISSVVRTLSARFEPTPADDDSPSAVPRVMDRRGDFVLHGPISRRGPPARSAVAVTCRAVLVPA